MNLFGRMNTASVFTFFSSPTIITELQTKRLRK